VRSGDSCCPVTESVDLVLHVETATPRDQFKFAHGQRYNRFPGIARQCSAYSSYVTTSLVRAQGCVTIACSDRSTYCANPTSFSLEVHWARSQLSAETISAPPASSTEHRRARFTISMYGHSASTTGPQDYEERKSEHRHGIASMMSAVSTVSRIYYPPRYPHVTLLVICAFPHTI